MVAERMPTTGAICSQVAIRVLLPRFQVHACVNYAPREVLSNLHTWTMNGSSTRKSVNPLKLEMHIVV